jgi:hypothetical protein
MPFRIRARDVVIEADSDRELRAVLAILGVLPSAGTPGHPHTLASPTSKDKLLRFYSYLGEGYQSQVIRALAESTVGLTDIELRNTLGFENNMKLAGVMSGLSKNAKSAGLSYGEIIEKQPTDGRDGSLYLYRLTAGVREIMPSGHARQLWEQNDEGTEG